MHCFNNASWSRFFFLPKPWYISSSSLPTPLNISLSSSCYCFSFPPAPLPAASALLSFLCSLTPSLFMISLPFPHVYTSGCPSRTPKALHKNTHHIPHQPRHNMSRKCPSSLHYHMNLQNIKTVLLSVKVAKWDWIFSWKATIRLVPLSVNKHPLGMCKITLANWWVVFFLLYPSECEKCVL